jgi:hypothetical protein
MAAGIEWIAQLRAAVMGAAVGGLGRYDALRVRQRLRLREIPSRRSTRRSPWSITMVDREVAGCVAVRPFGDRQWLEHTATRV